jgi:uncharacterized membrane protein
VLIIHLLAAFTLGGFILSDRLILRRTFDQTALKPLYQKAIMPTAIAAIVLIASGAALIQNAPIYYLKAALGLSTIALFFLCPLFSRGFGKKARFVYRLITVVLLSATIALGASIYNFS